MREVIGNPNACSTVLRLPVVVTSLGLPARNNAGNELQSIAFPVSQKTSKHAHERFFFDEDET
jgi:hypothetical protein